MGTLSQLSNLFASGGIYGNHSSGQLLVLLRVDFMVHLYLNNPNYIKLHPARAAFDAAMAAHNALYGAIDADVPEPKGVGRVPIPDEPKLD